MAKDYHLIQLDTKDLILALIVTGLSIFIASLLNNALTLSLEKLLGTKNTLVAKWIAFFIGLVFIVVAFVVLRKLGVFV